MAPEVHHCRTNSSDLRSVSGRNPGAFWGPDSGHEIKPRFRAHVLFQYIGPESGLDFPPGIWAPKCARIPAQKNQGSWPHPFPKAGRLLLHVRPANLTPSTALLMLGTPPGCWHRGCIGRAFFSTASRFLQCSRSIFIFDQQNCGTGTHGNGTPSPKTSPIFRV